MAELKATPVSNTALKALADALRSARSTVRPTGEGMLSSVGQFATDMVLPEGGIDELENWAYGNSPLHVPEMTNVPQFKRNTSGSRAGNAVDAAALLPVGAAAKLATAAPAVAKAGLIIPIKKGLNTNKARDADLLKAAKMAEELRGKGAKHQEIWEDTGVAAIPRTMRLGPEDGRWGQEVPFTADMLRSHVQLTPNERMEQAAAQFPRDWGRYMMGQDDLTPELKNAMDRPYMREGKYKLKELIDNQELEEQYPAMFDQTDVEIFNTPNRGTLGSASSSGDIRIWQPQTALFDDPQHSPFGVLTHELQHIGQNNYGMPRGSNVEQMQADPSTLGNMQMSLQEIAKTNPDAFKGGSPVAAALRQLNTNVGAEPFNRYQNVMGEQQARSSAGRAFMPQSMRQQIAPTSSWDAPAKALDPNIWRLGKSIHSPRQGLSPQDYASMLQEALRSSYGP